jgi:hypothetical protein
MRTFLSHCHDRDLAIIEEEGNQKPSGFINTGVVPATLEFGASRVASTHAISGSPATGRPYLHMAYASYFWVARPASVAARVGKC